MMKGVVPKIGSDPELGFVDNRTGKLLPASNIIHDHLSGVGLDGYSVTAEIRVMPSNSPMMHTQAIESILRTLPFCIGKHVRPVSGCLTLPNTDAKLGGHIHFPYNFSDNKSIRAMDYFLAIPVMMVTKPEHFVVRSSSQYGKLSNIETGKSHGGMEYRSLPSWLVSKGFTLSILSMAWVLFFELLDNTNPLLFKKVITRKDEQHFESCNKDYFIHWMKGIQRKYRTFRLYPKYRGPIESFFGLVYAFYRHKKNWGEGDDILKRWKIKRIPRRKYPIEIDKNLDVNKDLDINLRVRTYIYKSDKVRVYPAYERLIDVIRHRFPDGPSCINKCHLKMTKNYDLYIGIPNLKQYYDGIIDALKNERSMLLYRT